MPRPPLPSQTSQTPPITTTQFRASDFATDEGIGLFNTQWTMLTNAVSALQGAAGMTKLPSGVDVAGSTVTGLRAPTSPLDAVSSAHAESKYSAQALAPQFESGANSGLKSYRALNSKSQREQYSTFLNSVMNTSPTTNTSSVIGAAPSGGSVAVTITAGSHLYVDNSNVSYAQRTDTLSLPVLINISSAVRSGTGTVTLTLSSPSGLGPGSPFAVAGVTDPSFDGAFVAIAPTSGTTVTYAQAGGAMTSGGGTLSESGTTYYYFLHQGSQTLAISAPYPSDTQQNRINANFDQSVLIAVVVLNSGGVDLSQSAAGTTPPQLTNNSRILTRL